MSGFRESVWLVQRRKLIKQYSFLRFYANIKGWFPYRQSEVVRLFGLIANEGGTTLRRPFEDVVFVLACDDLKRTILKEVILDNHFKVELLSWTREPLSYQLSDDEIVMTTLPHTDLWQRTYYHFRNDNAPVLQMTTDDEFFSFTVKTSFDSKQRFDQCGVVVYLDSDNWLKASVEYENDSSQHLGSVVTNAGYSDWATTEIAADVKEMWYRLSRRGQDFRIECSRDGKYFQQMRICHLHAARGPIRFGLYACSPEASSFTARFTQMSLTEGVWQAHDGQQPDLV